MRTVGALLLILGCLCVIVAAVLPDLYPVWGAPPETGLLTIRDHPGTWLLCTTLFLIGAVAILAGVALVFGAVQGAPSAPLLTASLSLITAGTVLWTVNLAFRFTATLDVARGVDDGIPDWYLSTWGWVGALWSIAAVLIAVGFACLSLMIILDGSLPLWSAWIPLGFVALSLGLLIVMRDTPPIVLYLAPAAWAVAALLPRSAS